MGSIGTSTNPVDTYLTYMNQFNENNMPTEQQSAELDRLRAAAMEWRKANAQPEEIKGIASTLESAKRRGAFKKQRRF